MVPYMIACFYDSKLDLRPLFRGFDSTPSGIDHPKLEERLPTKELQRLTAYWGALWLAQSKSRFRIACLPHCPARTIGSCCLCSNRSSWPLRRCSTNPTPAFDTCTFPTTALSRC